MCVTLLSPDKFINEGMTWTALSSGTDKNLWSVYFPDLNTGFVGGSEGTILKTTNGGSSFIQENHRLKQSINVYPNPANHNITISIDNSSGNTTLLNVFNISGQKIMASSYINQNPIKLDVSSLEDGIYILKVETEEGLFTGKFLVLH